jgi:hypothetical protein
LCHRIVERERESARKRASERERARKRASADRELSKELMPYIYLSLSIRQHTSAYADVC